MDEKKQKSFHVCFVGLDITLVIVKQGEAEIPGSKAGNEMFNLSKEDDARKYIARKCEALHQDPQGPTSSYSHPDRDHHG
ncbi:uncharacterized protein ARMOST_12522 [Armillaria ostoyae]|uniref:Uncharacterized protein n=1 Tax=Armillaria ostoyae TaxID=47428 RepID=A0A284RK62_ARMOS|nr:uncharacterized protein ARMOST_12522 [Armillaria ostoyae]